MATGYTLSAIASIRPKGTEPCTDWSEGELLAEGFAGNPSTLRALQRRCGFSNVEAAKVCGITDRAYRKWLKGFPPDPAALRLLAILAGFVPWDGWNGWEVHQGLLFPPGYSRGGIPPGEYFALVFYRQQVSAYQEANAGLKLRVELLKNELQELRAQLGQRAQASALDLVAAG